MAKKRILCPYCFKHFFNVDAEYQCENNEVDVNMRAFCPTSPDEKFNNHWGFPVESRHIFRKKTLASSLFGAAPGPATCDVCGTETKRFVCPHCHNWLPSEMISEGAEIVSIIGAPNSGKTVYFISLIHELIKYGYKLGLTAIPKDEGPEKDKKTSMIYREKSKALFEMNSLPEKTAPLGENERSIPLIFSLTFKLPKSKLPKKTIYLVFYDTAGETFQDKEDMNMAKYLEESSGIILLLDPYTINPMRKTIENAVEVSDNVAASDEHHVLQRLLDYVSDASKLKGKPLALTFSKIDAFINGLEASGQSIPGIDLESNSTFLKTGKFSLEHVDAIDSTLLGALNEYCDGLGLRLRTTAEAAFQEQNVKMFAVSSLGCNPNADSTLDVVKPYRVLDPLIWVLYKMGFEFPVE